MTVSLYLRNEAGRHGVPVWRSFAGWIEAIPDLRRRTVGINILVVGTQAGRHYNQQFRGKDYATNVLAFPYEPLPGEKSSLLGDLVICAPVVIREARKQGKPLRNHYAHLTIHGVLHLVGYDHETEAEARCMEALECHVLASLGISDPYL